MLTHTPRWSHALGNRVVPSRWQATTTLISCLTRGYQRPRHRLLDREWDVVDRAAADYPAEQFPEGRDALTDDDAQWLDALGETISRSEEPREHEVESVSAMMGLQQADWLGLALGVRAARTGQRPRSQTRAS